MPTYDFVCPSGHIAEAQVARSVRVRDCSVCGLEGQRVVVYPGRTPGIGGAAVPPMRERRIPLKRFVEAQHTLVHEAEKAGTQVPDLLDIAKKTAREIRRHAPELIG